ncbi:hypothetical protein [Pseudanabaena sp. FACHB-2040]|uniref:hypothetical protein n=1 Tax=Pseudanabaena sp. FACHB-2040 TaxID=2692859 RepID=UPI0016894D14|nr:hypothetical protein [Pseudanabaena sp. FACHB-2040]MBD2261083.1 hypothetical protein [Pseudanabaena sp. FACHB-2040]
MSKITNKTDPTSASVFDAYDRYVQGLRASNPSSNEDSILTSLLVRRLIPVIGGPVPKGQRATPFEQQVALDYLKTIPAIKLKDAPILIEQAFTPEEKGGLRRARSIVNQFCQRLEEWRYFLPEKEKKQVLEDNRHKIGMFHSPAGQSRKDWGGAKTGRHHANRYGRSKKAPYALMAMKAVNTRGDKRTEQVFPEDYINDLLEADLQGFLGHSSSKAAGTITKQTSKIKQILGWLHRYKAVPLDQLRLSSIITYSEVLVDITDFLPAGFSFESLEDVDACAPDLANKVAVKKMILDASAETAARENRLLTEDFLGWLGLKAKSQIAYVDVFLSIACFIYRNELASSACRESRTIPTIRELLNLKRLLEKEVNNHSESVPFHLKSIPWEECIRVVEELRLRYEEKYTYTKETRVKHGTAKKKRTPYALARDLQDFLSIALMVVIPPDRSRTYYELELGRTFVFGAFDGRSFTPAAQLKRHSDAKWYIHLEMEDYKTGKRYGTYWAPIPDIMFVNGVTLYEYIDEWLSWGRESHKPVNHNFFFRGTSDGGSLNHSDWNIRVTTLFERHTGVAVAPKELRKIYISYLKSSRATRAELEAASVAQHHSQKMQDSVYDQREQMDKLQPIYDFNERVIDAIFEEMDNARRADISNTPQMNTTDLRLEYKKHLDETEQCFDVIRSTINEAAKGKDVTRKQPKARK